MPFQALDETAIDYRIAAVVEGHTVEVDYVAQVCGVASRIWLKAKHYPEAYNEYRFLCATNPNTEAFQIGLADTLIGISSLPKMRADRPDVDGHGQSFAIDQDPVTVEGDQARTDA